MADELQTQDQFLIDQKIIPNPEKRASTEKLKKTTGKLARNAALLALTLQHTVAASEAINNQAKLEEQLKFQGLRAYARINNLQLSTKFVDHFLYGNGEKLDITGDVVSVLKENAQSDFSTPQAEGITDEMSTDQVYEKYIQNAFSRIVHGPDSEEKAVFVRTLDENGEEIYHSTDELHSLIGKNIRMFRIDELIGDDPFYSLGNFTASIEGRLSEIDENGNAILENSRFYINDTYDWQRDMDLNAETSVGNLVEGSPLENIIPDSLKDVAISVNDDDGAALVETGIAFPFDITAEVQFDRSISVPTNNIALPPSNG